MRASAVVYRFVFFCIEMSGEAKSPSTANIEKVCGILSDIKTHFATFISQPRIHITKQVRKSYDAIQTSLDNLQTLDASLAPEEIPKRMKDGIGKLVNDFVPKIGEMYENRKPLNPRTLTTLGEYARALLRHDLMYTFPADAEGEDPNIAAVSCAKLFKDICLEYFSVGYIDNILTTNTILTDNNIAPDVDKSVVYGTQLPIWRWKSKADKPTATYMMNGARLTTTESFVQRILKSMGNTQSRMENLREIVSILESEDAFDTVKNIMGFFKMVAWIRQNKDYDEVRRNIQDTDMADLLPVDDPQLFTDIQTILNTETLRVTMESIVDRSMSDVETEIIELSDKLEQQRVDLRENAKRVKQRLGDRPGPNSRLVSIWTVVIADEHLLDDIGSNEAVHAKHRELVEYLVSERKIASDNAIVHAMYMHALRHHRVPIYLPIQMGVTPDYRPNSHNFVRTKHALHMGMGWLYRAAVHVHQKGLEDGYGNMVETSDIDARLLPDDTITNRTQFIQYGKCTHEEVVTVRVGMILFGDVEHAYGLLLQVRIEGTNATFRYTVLDVNFSLEDEGFASALQPSKNMKRVLAGIFDTRKYVYEPPEYNENDVNISISEFSLCCPHTRLWILVFVSATGTGTVGLIENLRILKKRFDERTLTFGNVVKLMGDDWKKTMGKFVSSGVPAHVAAPVAAASVTAPEEYVYPDIGILKEHGIGYIMDSSSLVSTWFVMKPPPPQRGKEFRYVLAGALPWCKMRVNITWVLLFLATLQPGFVEDLIRQLGEGMDFYIPRLSAFVETLEPVTTPLQCEMIMETIQIIKRWEPALSDLSAENSKWIEQLPTNIEWIEQFLSPMPVASHAEQKTNSLRGTYDVNLRAQFVKLRL